MPNEYRKIPSGCKFWPESTSPAGVSIADMYEKGFAGAWADDKAKAAAIQSLVADGGYASAGDACRKFGLAGSGAGKLSILFPAVEKCYPGSLPGPAQERGDCFAAGTVCFGERTKTIENVQVGDMVWSGKGELTRVVSVREQTSYKPIVTIHPVGSLPISCTSDHRVLVYRLPKVGKQTINHRSYAHALSKAGKNTKSAIVATYETRRAEWIAAGDIKGGDCLLTPLSFSATELDRSFSGIHSKPDGMFVLGFFIGNGHASGHSVEFVSPKCDVLDRVVAVLRECGFSPKVDNQRGCQRVRVHSVEFVDWLRKQFYDASKCKIFPSWAIGNGEFLSGLKAADGHSKDKCHKLDSTSLSICYGAYVTLIGMGFEPVISIVARSKGTYANAKPLYRLIWRDDKAKQYTWRDESYLVRPIRSIEIKEGPTTVYDIGVECGSHSFIANGVVVHNCVSHNSKNAALASLCNEIMFGTPDEVTGLREAAPDVPPAGIENGVLSSEFHYWYRGFSQDGWDCWSAAEVARKNGIMLRKPYPELGIDLSVYSGELAGKFGRTAPPQKITDEGRLHCVRTVTQCEGLEQVRDLLANGYGCSSCGSEGFQNERDADGVSRRSGSWAHAMAYLGFDDRPETVRKHGGPLILVMNSWGIWNKGPRRISGTQIDIPEGSFWAKWNEVKGREVIAYSSVNGWPQKKLPDYGFHVFG